MIEVSNLTKRFGSKVAVDNASFRVSKGEIVGFLGPNGAGKSTTMNILTGYLSATEGTAKIDGIDILENPIEAKKKIGYLPERPPLYYDMTVQEQLNFVCDLRGIEKEKKKEEIERACQLVKITDVMGRTIKNLSKGYKQRVGLAQTLISTPDVLILDEPTVGLDPKQIIDIRNVITELGRTHTIILSSHILPEVSAVCERVLVINQGRIVGDDTPENLSARITGEHKFSVRISGDKTEVVKAIKGINGIKFCDVVGMTEPGSYDYMVEAQSGIDIRKPLFFELASKSYPILMLKPFDISLEDIFLKLTQQEPEKEAKNS